MKKWVNADQIFINQNIRLSKDNKKRKNELQKNGYESLD